MKTSSSSKALLGTIVFLLAIGCGSNSGTSGADESDGGAGTSNSTGTGGAGASGTGGSSTGTGGSAGSSSGAGGSSGAAGEQDASHMIPPPDAVSQRDAMSVPDATSSGNCSAAIVLADCDLRRGLHAKRWFDAVGHYSRADTLVQPHAHAEPAAPAADGRA